jgi:predicted nucleotidyltransferase
MNKLNKLLFATSQQKILSFLVDDFSEYTEKEVSKNTDVKKSAVNLALRDLVACGLIKKRKVGRTSLVQADFKNNLIKEIKILKNILEIQPLVEKLKKESLKIILFGSFAKGLNYRESDIDLFVLANNDKAIRKIVNNSEFSELVQLIFKTPSEMLKINKNKPLLFQEIEKGKTLWEINEN